MILEWFRIACILGVVTGIGLLNAVMTSSFTNSWLWLPLVELRKPPHGFGVSGQRESRVKSLTLYATHHNLHNGKWNEAHTPCHWTGWDEAVVSELRLWVRKHRGVCRACSWRQIHASARRRVAPHLKSEKPDKFNKLQTLKNKSGFFCLFAWEAKSFVRHNLHWPPQNSKKLFQLFRCSVFFHWEQVFCGRQKMFFETCATSMWWRQSWHYNHGLCYHFRF